MGIKPIQTKLEIQAMLDFIQQYEIIDKFSLESGVFAEHSNYPSESQWPCWKTDLEAPVDKGVLEAEADDPPRHAAD